MQKEEDFVFKILLSGNSPVGKSSLTMRFSDNVFNENFISTIGVDFKTRTLDINGSTVKLNIWDTAGQERFKILTGSYYKGAQGIILVYDITNKQSFQDIQNWLECITLNNKVAQNQGSQNVARVLVGNKSDLGEQRQVTYEEGKQLADSLNIRFFETSAKDSSNVEKVFITLADEVKANLALTSQQQ